MTPARAELEAIVGALRRKQLLAVVVAALVEMMLAAAVLYAVLRIGLPNLVLSPSRRLVLVAGLVLVFVAAMLLEQARQSRSFLYLAKQIDDANQLGDHLVSAVSFADPTTLPFEQACVNSLILRLRERRPAIPEVRLERVWLLAPAILLAGATGVVEWRRRHLPTDDGQVQVALPAETQQRLDLLQKSAIEAAKVDRELANQADEARRVLGQYVERAASKESVLGAISQVREGLRGYDQSHPSLIDLAIQLGDPSTQRATQLLQAMRNGDANELKQAMAELIKQMQGLQPPPLTPEERQEVAAMFDQLAKATRNAALAGQLGKAADSVRNDATGPQAGAPVKDVLDPLVKEFDHDRVARDNLKAIRATLNEALKDVELQARQRPTGGAGGAGDAGAADSLVGDGGARPVARGKDDPGSDEAMTSDPETSGTGGATAGSAVGGEGERGRPESALAPRNVHISSPWVGASATQVVTASAGSDENAKKEIREILGNQQRAIERDVRREEIPAEYAQAIRRYFFNVQRDLEKK